MEEKTYVTGVEEDIQLPYVSKSLLGTISKWTKYLSILGFIFLALMAVFVIISGFLMSNIREYVDTYAYGQHHSYYMAGARFGWFYVILCLVVLAVYFIPLLFLYKFSTGIHRGISSKYTFNLNDAFRYLKNHYVFIGVLTIIGLVMFIVSMGAMLAGWFAMM